jgi:gamma-glutamyltranspeptidase / glutathione hydrolase
MTKQARQAMVVAAQPEACEAGADILRAGGNAVDAAIATAFVQGVIDPLMTGIGGFGSMGIYLPSRGEHSYIDFHAPAPGKARPDMWASLIEGETRDGFGFLLKGRVNDIGYQSICVPLALKAYHEAHTSFGRLPWSEVLQPAIAWAERGWMVRPHVHWFWSQVEQLGRVPNPERIAFSANGRELYCRADGSPKQVGDLVRNPDLAQTLRLIARDGADVFYRGEIASRIDEDMRRNGGLVTREDLASCRVVRNQPLRGSYRGYSVSTNHPPGGGLMLLQMLNVLEQFDLRELGHNSPEYVRVVAEAMKRATADKDAFIGDPAFVDVPMARLLSKDRARAAAQAIRAGVKAEVPRLHGGLPSKDTTQLCVVDADGGCITMTHSLGSPSGVISDGLGFMYNGCMGVFDPRPGSAGSIAPGKARFSSMCPSIFFGSDGQPCLVIGAPGATQIAMGVLQASLNVLDFGMAMTEAVSAPRFSATSPAIDVSNRIPYAVTEALERDGYEVIRSPYGFGFAAIHGVRIAAGTLDGGADPGHDGMALAVRL